MTKPVPNFRRLRGAAPALVAALCCSCWIPPSSVRFEGYAQFSEDPIRMASDYREHPEFPVRVLSESRTAVDLSVTNLSGSAVRFTSDSPERLHAARQVREGEAWLWPAGRGVLGCACLWDLAEHELAPGATARLRLHRLEGRETRAAIDFLVPDTGERLCVASPAVGPWRPWPAPRR